MPPANSEHLAFRLEKVVRIALYVIVQSLCKLFRGAPEITGRAEEFHWSRHPVPFGKGLSCFDLFGCLENTLRILPSLFIVQYVYRVARPISVNKCLHVLRHESELI